MKKMVKSVRRGALAIALSLAMVISIFAGTGMEVRAEGEFDYEAVPSDENNFWNVLKTLDKFTPEERDRIGIWLNTLTELKNTDTVFIVCVLYGGEAGSGYEAWANGNWLEFGSSGNTYTNVTGLDDVASYKKIYIVKRTSTSTTSCSESPAPHTHSYSWVTVQEVTADQDGIEEYRCSCGDVQGRNVLPASVVFVKGLYGAIKDAPQGGTATFDSGRLYTISDYVIRKLAERPDVTTVITFEYQNQKYKMTIPAGVDYTSLLADADYFYGYFYFANAVGATIEAL